MQGLEADASSSGLIDKRTEAESGLSSEQIEAVMASLYGAGRSALVSGSCALGAAAQPTFVVNMSLTFPQVIHPHTPLESWHASYAPVTVLRVCDITFLL